MPKGDRSAAEGFRLLPGIPALIFLLAAFFLPLVMIFSAAFLDSGGGFSLRPFAELLSSRGLARLLGFTIYQALLSTLAALAMGLPGAWFLARTQFPGRKLVRSLSIIPFVLPPILVVLGFVSAFGNNGILNRLLMALTGSSEPPLRVLYSLKGIILAHGFYNFPVVLRIVSSVLSSLPRAEEDAALLLGARRSERFFSIIFPRILPAVLSSMVLVFLFCFSSFAVIMVLGGGPKHSTIEVEIYRLARISLDIPAAGRLALIASLIGALPLLAVRRAKSAYFVLGRESKELRKSGRGVRLVGLLYAAIMLLFVIFPLAGIIINGFLAPSGPLAEAEFSLRWFTSLLHDRSALEAAAGSLMLGGMTVLISLPLAGGLALATVRSGPRRAALFELLAGLPMTVSSVIIGAAYLSLSTLLPSLGSRPLFIAAAHSVIAFPFVFRTMLTVVGKSESGCRKAAISLGARPARAFVDVELPMMEHALFSAAAFAFALSVGEMNASLTLSGGNFTNLPIAIYRLIGSYQFYKASALGTLLMLLCALAFLYIDKGND